VVAVGTRTQHLLIKLQGWYMNHQSWNKALTNYQYNGKWSWADGKQSTLAKRLTLENAFSCFQQIQARFLRATYIQEVHSQISYEEDTHNVKHFYWNVHLSKTNMGRGEFSLQKFHKKFSPNIVFSKKPHCEPSNKPGSVYSLRLACSSTSAELAMWHEKYL
jgi:hypothetical protein